MATEQGEQNQMGSREMEAIDDKMIVLGHVFAVEASMNRWNVGARHSQRAEVRDAFPRNDHRANRWHPASIVLAEKMRFLEPQPRVAR